MKRKILKYFVSLSLTNPICFSQKLTFIPYVCEGLCVVVCEWVLQSCNIIPSLCAAEIAIMVPQERIEVMEKKIVGGVPPCFMFSNQIYTKLKRQGNRFG